MPSIAADSLTMRRVTAAEYRSMPESMTKSSLIGGFLIEEPAGSDNHQSVSVILSSALFDYVRRKKLGAVRHAPYDVWLNEETVLQPDVLFVSNEKLSIIRKDGIHGAPDLVVEILSPSTKRFDRVTKRPLFARSGVREMWIIDTDRQLIEVYRFGQSVDQPVETLTTGQHVTTPLLPGLRLSLSRFFES